MRREQEDKLDPNQPALIVTYGNTKRKHRPLEGDVTVLGRQQHCDLGLMSPEVAPVHCVVLRGAHGWRIRDCSGRPGTIVNGKSILEAPLCDGDIIQVGSFSFQAHLPAAHAAVPAAPAPAAAPEDAGKRSHLQRSRRNLAEHAIRLRRQLREKAGEQAELARRQADLQRQEARVRAFGQQLEEQRRALEKQAVQAPAVAPAPLAPALDRRRQELAHYANHLRRWDRRLQARQEELARQEPAAEVPDLREQMRQRDQQVAELLRLVEEAKQAEEAERSALEVELQQQRLELERERAQLAQEKAALERLLPDVTPEPPGEFSDEGVRNKLAGVRRLRQELAERRKQQAGLKGPRSRQLRRVQSEQRQG